MKIRTRYTLFKWLILLSLALFVFSLVDMFALDAKSFSWVMIAYAAFLIIALLLYLGYKPDLSAEPQPEAVAEPVAEAVPVSEPVPVVAEPLPEPEPETPIEEIARPQPRVVGYNVEGPENFRCPFCRHTFALEATHIHRAADFRMNCPYCANSIRVPRSPMVSRGMPVTAASEDDRRVFACASCGEVLRFTAPQSHLARALNVVTCPQCAGRDVSRAVIS